MKNFTHAILLSSILIISGCASDQVLTALERVIQHKADTVVAEYLFDRELDQTASYIVSKAGKVTISFDSNVPFKQYNEAVEYLRRHPDISAVYAEQNGVEVCPLRM